MIRLLRFLLVVTVSLSGIAQQTSPPFSIAITTDRSTVAVGDPVQLNIALTNLSNHAIDCSGVASNGLDRSYEYRVEDPSGKVLPKKLLAHPEIGETFSPWPCTVKPGASARAAGGLISQVYSFEEPGRYTVIVSRHIGGSSQAEISSNPLTITVTPKP